MKIFTDVNRCSNRITQYWQDHKKNAKLLLRTIVVNSAFLLLNASKYPPNKHVN